MWLSIGTVLYGEEFKNCLNCVIRVINEIRVIRD